MTGFSVSGRGAGSAASGTGNAVAPAQPQAGAATLAVENLRIGVAARGGLLEAVKGVSLSVGPGEMVGLVGESGSGKTLTAMAVCGLLPPRAHVISGSIRIRGTDALGLNRRGWEQLRAGQVGVVFQDAMSALNPRLTIGSQVMEALPAELRHNRAEAKEHAASLLADAGIPHPRERLGSYPHELSGGLLQRVVIAMAVARRPALLVADEPTTALDVSVQGQILDMLDRLRSELNLAVLLITHDLRLVQHRAARTVVVYAGEVVEEGPTAELAERPHHRYTVALLEAIPGRAPRRAPLASIQGDPPRLDQRFEGCPFAPRCSAASDPCSTAPPLWQVVATARYRCWHPQTEPLGGIVPRPQVASPRPPTGDHSSASPPPVAELVDLRKTYRIGGGLTHLRAGVTAAAGVDLDVPADAFTGLLGESGCGKTTIGRLLAGVEHPDSGAVRFEGAEIWSLSRTARAAWRRQVQLVFQDPYSALDRRMTVEAIVAEPLVIQGGLRRREIRDRARQLLSDVGLTHQHWGRRPTELSGGQLQRVSLARALTLAPKLLVADEPLSSLDVSLQAKILDLLVELQRRYHFATVLISHDIEVVRYLCDRVSVMYMGRIVETGDASLILAAPRHPYTAGLLASLPGSDGNGRLRGEPPSAMSPPSGCAFRTRCPYAQERCAVEIPQLWDVGDGGRAACHFPLVTAPLAGGARETT